MGRTNELKDVSKDIIYHYELEDVFEDMYMIPKKKADKIYERI